jgi:septal ring factor EnvC (AmiA/AmiB activator)
LNLDQFDGHTPGPWAPVELMAFAAGFAVEDAECRTVARIMKTHEAAPLPARANAALIAAAPGLLSEVRRLTTELRRERDELRTSLAESMQQCRDTQDRLTAMQAECRKLAARLAEIEKAEPVAWDCEYRSGERFLSYAKDPMADSDCMAAFPLIARPAPVAAR